MNHSEDLRAVVKRVLWFEEPDEALKYPNRFLAYLMTNGTEADIDVARRYYTDADFEAALDEPVPGIFDLHAWSKWNVRYGRVPVPPLPKRVFPGEVAADVRESLFHCKREG